MLLFKTSSIKLRWENLTDVRHEFIKRVVNEEFVSTTRDALTFQQLKDIYRHDVPDGFVKVLGQHGKLFVFNGTAIILIEDGRLFAAKIKCYY